MRAFLIALLAAAFLPASALAAAWTLKEHEAQLIENIVYYTTDRYFDPEGNKTSQARFTKWEYNPYFEYGFSDKLTLGASAFLQRLDQAGAENLGVGDVELFARRQVWDRGGFVFSLQPLIKLPWRQQSERFPEAASGQTDLELRALAGYAFEALGRYHFFNLEAGYRKRLESPEDQYRLSAALGVRPADRWLLLAESNATLSADLPSASSAAIAGAADYDLVKGQLSAVYELSPRVSVQAGVFDHLYARNTGGGEGGVLSLWIKF